MFFINLVFIRIYFSHNFGEIKVSSTVLGKVHRVRM